MNKDRGSLVFVEFKFVNNHDELVKIAMDYKIKYIKEVSVIDAFDLEETKRRKLLNHIKSYQCNNFTKISRICKYNQEETVIIDKWPKIYDAYEKEQEANFIDNRI